MKECMTPLLGNKNKMSIANKSNVFLISKNIHIHILTNTINAAFI